MDFPEQIFHLAIPSHDLDLANEYYVEKLGSLLSRRYDDRITLKFFGHQVVCHLTSEKIEPNPSVYPRHFGITFRSKTPFYNLIELVKRNKILFYKEPFVRFKGKQEEHETFFLIDPSNNVLEFKFYQDPQMMY